MTPSSAPFARSRDSDSASLVLGTLTRANKLPQLRMPSRNSPTRSKVSAREGSKSHRDAPSKSPRGAKTSRPDLERPSSWGKSLGFEHTSSNNPILNGREPALHAKYYHLPRRGFSKFLADGVRHVAGRSCHSLAWICFWHPRLTMLPPCAPIRGSSLTH